MKRILLLAICLTAVSFGACSNETSLPVATGKGSIRAINTIPTSPSFSFRIEEQFIGSVAYKASSPPARWDDLEYNFNFDVVLAGDQEVTRIATEFLDVQRDRDYTYVVSGEIAAPVITLWEGDERTWVGDETVFEVRFGHTAASLGNVDVYFADASVPPALGSEIGTLAFGEILAATDFETAEYILTITAAGDPTTVHFVSEPLTVGAQIAAIISIFDGDANELAPFAVRLFNLVAGGAGAVVDSRFPPTLRLFHTSKDFGSTDIYFDDPLTTPEIAGQVFGDFTGDLEVPAGVLPLTYTTADNIGSILIDAERPIIIGTRTHLYVVRNSLGNDVLVDHRPDRRPVENIARLSIINTATSHTGLDVYIVPRDTSIDEASPFLQGLPLSGDPVDVPLVAGSFDIVITVLQEKTILTGPIPIDVALGDVSEAIIYENDDPAVVDLVFIPIP